MTRQFFARLGLAAALALPGLAAARAQDFPSRPITIMVGLAPGGITDVTARLYAEAVSGSIGQRIIIENRQGAGGAVAAAAVQNASAGRIHVAGVLRVAARGRAGGAIGAL